MIVFAVVRVFVAGGVEAIASLEDFSAGCGEPVTIELALSEAIDAAVVGDTITVGFLLKKEKSDPCFIADDADVPNAFDLSFLLDMLEMCTHDERYTTEQQQILSNWK